MIELLSVGIVLLLVKAIARLRSCKPCHRGIAI
jgi:hypothetical protein